MSEVNGIVERINHNEKYGSYGLLVNGKWYNTKFEPKCNEGDSVAFDDGGKNYCKSLRLVSEPTRAKDNTEATPNNVLSDATSVPLSRDRCILRQNALGRAVESITPTDRLSIGDDESTIDLYVKTVLNVARQFESYTSGDLDLEMVAERLTQPLE